MSKDPWLFNGAKFRFHSFCLLCPKCHPSSSVSSKHPPCILSPEVVCAGVVEGELHSRKRRQERSPDTDPVRGSVIDAVGNCLCQNSRVKQSQQENGAIQKTTETFVQASFTCDCSPSEDMKSDPPRIDINTDIRDARAVLTLRLGLTCYKDFLGTNWSCQAVDLRKRGEAEFSDPLALLAQPLGVGAVLCTDDRQVVLIRRSQRVAEAPESLDIPGGHPEPKVRRLKLLDRKGVILDLMVLYGSYGNCYPFVPLVLSLGGV